LYEAVQDFDGDDCAAEARRVAMEINNLGQRSARRRRQASASDEVDPIFNFMTVATTIDSADGGGGGGNGGAAFFTMSYLILIAAMLLAIFA